jgi:hypothetical protein
MEMQSEKRAMTPGALVRAVLDVCRGLRKMATDALSREDYATADDIVGAMGRWYAAELDHWRERYAGVLRENARLTALLADELRKAPSP